MSWRLSSAELRRRYPALYMRWVRQRHPERGYRIPRTLRELRS